MTDREWYLANNCTHSHCPENCESPQPSLRPDGSMLCMKCACLFGVESEMIPCVPATCPEAKP